jgi:hypothetical protein
MSTPQEPAKRKKQKIRLTKQLAMWRARKATESAEPARSNK